LRTIRCANSDPDCHRNSDSNIYTNANSNRHIDACPEAYTNTKTSSQPCASPVTFLNEYDCLRTHAPHDHKRKHGNRLRPGMQPGLASAKSLAK